jgi:manganese/zinc/iron transport system substrate-binding protein
MKRIVVVLIWLVTVFAIQMPAQADTPLRVVATTTQAADLVRILAQDRVELTALMGAGVDPHLYKPTESDIAAMNETDLVVYSGLHLEGQFDAVFEALGERNIRIYRMSASVEQAGFVLQSLTQSASTPDPHFWFDPRNWQLVALDLAQVLGELDPANADFYQANAEAYNNQLLSLFDWGNESIGQIPAEQRYIVTSHDAFQYFGDAFGMEMVSIQGISTADEAGVADIQGVVEFVAQNQIPVLFVESSVPPNTIEAVQEAVQAQGWEVGLGVRPLYSDAMGEPETFGGTYIGMIAENVITILQSFGYPIPEWPEALLPVPSDNLLDMNDLSS